MGNKQDFNKEMIAKYIDDYKMLYVKQHGETPKSWFNYLKWLGSFTTASSFDDSCVDLVKELLNS